MVVKAYGVTAANQPVEPIDIERRATGPHDVQVEIAFCGICHTDLHQVRDEHGGTLYPCVPGHEIVGHVTEVGAEVTGFRVGDTVGVGCLVDSCRRCSSCAEGQEQYCENGLVATYNFPTPDAPGHTLGGYSQRIVVDEKFVLRISHAEEDLAAVAPLLCAGITLWSPLRHWNAGPGKKVGIVGIGGLGHMGVKLAHALGAQVVAFTTSESKRVDALALGAQEVVVSRNADEMKRHANSFDMILDTVSAPHDLDAFTTLLKRDGTLILLGAPESKHPAADLVVLLVKRRQIAGSMIGGLAETQEMLDFCAQRGIVSDIEMIPIQQIEQAFQRMQANDVKYRFVIDNASLAV